MQREIDLIKKSQDAKEPLTKWKATCSDQDLGKAVEVHQTKEIDEMYDRHLNEIRKHLDLRNTMLKGHAQSFFSQSFMSRLKEANFSGRNLKGSQKVYDTYEENIHGIIERQSREWTNLVAQQREYRMSKFWSE